MNNTFLILTIVLIVVSVAMILIILVQRPQGGGLAAAFGGAGGGGTDTVFGGRVGDALTVMTVIAFILFLGLAVALNLVESKSVAPDATVSDTTSLVAPVTTNSSAPVSLPASGSSDHPTNSGKSDHPNGGNQ
jgi:preprotein translocase subunit SecG